ncbi:DUF1932 domain-containing protein [Aquibacillus sp. 3ASR75-11]|uniref:DUF1932 domain-containing protein n=1 Tax=Terrihalobacillus insolitus TaxID=2950438 RepID=A0A9X4ALC3_9BACI|nr:NAD(P)-dependent oxidoreductase [Terrihalobacillus insolitus]MDC3424222.1 DUF1932 domain-containing protein [Terrihalobacillus insolitus]
MNNLGFIGFGEASFHIARGLSSNIDVYAFDINATHKDLGPIIGERAEQANVKLLPSLEELAQSCTIILSATSAKIALKIAQDCLPYIQPDHTYVDMNAASPMVKEEIEKILSEKNVSFVDVAVMGSVPAYGHKVPMLLSGSGASEFFTFGKALNMDFKVISDQPGGSSAIKMVRSIFMKGFTMLAIETLQAGIKYDIVDEIMESIGHTIDATEFKKLANNLITRTAIHSERRVAEMEEVLSTLERFQVDSTLSNATKEKLKQISEQHLAAYFDYRPPDDLMEVIKVLDGMEVST